MSDLLSLARKIDDRFPEVVQEIVEFRGDVTLVINRSALIEVCTFCRDDEALQMNRLSSLSGVDYWPEEPRFAVHYVLHSLALNHELRLKVYAPGDHPVVPSLTALWRGADWPEREVYDMFGITFEGHPNLRRILMPHDWTGYPQRKDYPLGYEEVEFTFNFERVQSKKPFPRE
jgi:NADH-quinone oxidoreductase subunit C